MRIALGNDPEDMARLQTSFLDHARLGANGAERSAAASSRIVGSRHFRETYTHLYGEGAYRDLRNWTTMARVSNWGSIGTMNETLQSGSRQTSAMLGEAAMDSVTGQPGASVIKRAMRTIAKADLGTPEARRMYDLAFTNPEVLSAIMKAGQMSAPEWKKHMTSVLARHGAAGE